VRDGDLGRRHDGPGAGRDDHTRANAGSFLAVALNGKVVSAPMIMSSIEGGVIQLEGTQPTEFAAFAPCFGR
jgi:preprotein translocase subunit SecD